MTVALFVENSPRFDAPGFPPIDTHRLPILCPCVQTTQLPPTAEPTDSRICITRIT